jgi:hypothetical protein
VRERGKGDKIGRRRKTKQNKAQIYRKGEKEREIKKEREKEREREI